MPGPHTVVIVHRDETKTEVVEAVAGRTVDVKPSFLPKALVPTADTRTRPTPPPPPKPEQDQGTSILAPPAKTWPFYAAGAVGLGGLAAAAIFGGLAAAAIFGGLAAAAIFGGLAAAAIFGGLHANAAHAVEVSRETLIREGKSPAECARGIPGPEGDPRGYDETCATMARNERFARMHKEAFGVSLLVGLAGTAIAAGWFFFAPKERAEPTARVHHVVPWIGLGAAGATFEGRF